MRANVLREGAMTVGCRSECQPDCAPASTWRMKFQLTIGPMQIAPTL
jgi:hypothetical protein